MHAMLTCIIASFLKRKHQYPFCAMPQPSQMCAGTFIFVQQQFWDLLCLFTRVLAQHNYTFHHNTSHGTFQAATLRNERNQSASGRLKV